MSSGKDLTVVMLLDFYGDLLTEKQRNVIELYYDEDLSLGEIAEHENITRQGVRDCIKRGEQTMREMEEKLGMMRRFSGYNETFGSIISAAETIKKECSVTGSTKRAQQCLDRIISLATKGREL